MPSSLLKFSELVEHSGRRVFWDRVDVDGAPYRGPAPPIMPEEEYEARAVRVADPKNGFFDVSKPEDNKAYLAVLDACFNGWFQCIHIDRFWRGTTQHYVEWVEYFMEDGARTPYLPHGIMELSHGQGNVSGNSSPGANGAS